VRPPGRRAEDDVNLITGTLRSHPRPGSTGPGSIAVTPVALRGRDGGGQIEAGEPGSPAFTVCTPGGGSSYPMIAHTLAGEGFDAFNPQSGGSEPRIGYGDKPTALQASQVTAVHEAAAVRRLTPVECERLQGFPDDWTRWLDDGSEQSDSARYRQCGNAVAVPVAEWIARRVVAVDQASAAEGAAMTRLLASLRPAGDDR
jgi:DNA (cytosine-5)-methyltransferase 1